MHEVTERARIGRPVSEVWAALADFAGLSRWAPNVDHSSLTTGQSEGVGATRRVQMGRNALLETVVEWHPDSTLAYTISGLPPVLRSVTNTWRLTAAGNATDVTLTSAIDAGPRPPQQLVARIAGRRLAIASRAMLDGLESDLEEDVR